MINLRNARKAKALSMKALGKLINVSESTISLYENGKRNPDNKTLNMLADVLEVSVDYLLGRTDNEKPTPKKQDEPKTNTILIAGRDGRTIERKLTTTQIELIERMLKQMPDCNDDDI